MRKVKKRIGRLAGVLFCLLCFLILLPENVKAGEETAAVSSLTISGDGQSYGELYGAPYSETDDSQWLTLKLGGRGLRIVDDNNTDLVLVDQFGSVYIGGELCNPGQTEGQGGVKADFSYGFMYFLVIAALLLGIYNFVAGRRR